MLRKKLIEKHTNASSVAHVIGHNGSVFFKDAARTILLLIILYVVFLLINQYVDFAYTQRIIGIIGIILLIKYTIDFLNLYLDSIVLAPNGITFFLREGLMEYKTEFFDWDKIETISHEQDSIWDKIFGKGDLVISLEHGIKFPFENISSPQKHAEKMRKLKNRFVADQKTVGDNPTEDKRLSILMEALSEVVKDYVDKKDTQNDDYEYDDDYY